MSINSLREVLSGEYARYFPEKTAERFPRIIYKIEELWGSVRLDAYFSELLLMDRPDRQGFPPEIVMELFELSSAYDRMKSKDGRKKEDVWGEGH